MGARGSAKVIAVGLRGEKLQKAKLRALEALTVIQRRFVEELSVDMNISKAASRAGFSEKTGYASGSRLLKKPEVQEALGCLLAEKAEVSGITTNRIVAALWRNHRKALKGYPVVNKVGDVVGYKPDIGASNRALELLGKHIGGMFAERVDVTSGGEKIKAADQTTQIMIIAGQEVEF